MRDTPSRLRDAAERLLAERPYGHISLRDITEAAGANVASVGYHFGSKDALLDEVVRRALTDVFDRQGAQLAQLPDEAGLDEIVRAWLLPAFSVQDVTDDDQRRHTQILQNALAAPSPAITVLLAEMGAPVQRILLDRIARHVPHLTPAELAFRHTAILAALGALGIGVFRSMLSGTDPGTLTAQLIAWVVGGLTAAPASEPRTGGHAVNRAPS